MRTRIPTTAKIFGFVPASKLFSILFSQQVAVTLCEVRATALKPVRIRIAHFVETAFDAGTTNPLKLGNSTSDTAYSADLIAGGDDLEFIIRANTNIIATYAPTGTAATAGRSDIVIELTPLA